MRKGALASLVLLFLVVGSTGGVIPARAQSRVSWQAEYFNNTSLSGPPVLVRTEPLVRYNWRYGSPDPRVNNDFFSARWMANVNFPETGWYRFRIMADDGSRLYIDGVRVWDHWIRQWAVAFGVDVYLPAGAHQIKLEYFDAEEVAVASMYWYKLRAGQEGGPGANAVVDLIGQAVTPPQPGQPTPTSAPAPGDLPPPTPNPTPVPYIQPTIYRTAWRGEYFNNTTLAGVPALTRDDPDINFDWGTGSPDPSIAVDGFSVRWTRTLSFTAGDYAFTAYADDGVRVFLDGVPIINDWGPRQGQPIVHEQFVPAGDHTVVMEYFEGQGGALARLVIFNKAGGGPTTGNVSFIGDRSVINAGECLTLTWNTAGVQAVYFEGQGVPGNLSKLVCPTQTRSYTLTVLFQDNTQQNFFVTVNVNGVLPPNTGILTGRLVWQSTGQPVLGADLRLCQQVLAAGNPPCNVQVGIAASNANGDFYFSPVFTGSYQITARLPGCPNPVSWYNFVDGLSQPQTFTVVANTQVDIGTRAVSCPP